MWLTATHQGKRRCTNPGFACLRCLFVTNTEQLLSLLVRGLAVFTGILSQAPLPVTCSNSDRVCQSITRAGEVWSAVLSRVSSGMRWLGAICCQDSLPHIRDISKDFCIMQTHVWDRAVSAELHLWLSKDLNTECPKAPMHTHTLSLIAQAACTYLRWHFSSTDVVAFVAFIT